MKKLLPLLLILLLLLSACGAPAEQPDPAPEETPESEPGTPEAPEPTTLEGMDEDELPIFPADGSGPAREEDAPALGEETVTLDGIDSYLRVTLPEGWTWAQAAGAVEGTVYGLWPEDDPDFKVELHWWPERFAMCGTGVTFQDYTLPNGQKATLAYERIGEDFCWTLILPESPDSFTIQFNAPYALYEAHRAELEQMLGTLQQGVLAHPDVVPVEEATG